MSIKDFDYAELTSLKIRDEWGHLWNGSYAGALNFDVMSVAEIPNSKITKLGAYLIEGVH